MNGDPFEIRGAAFYKETIHHVDGFPRFYRAVYPTDREWAFRVATETNRLALGVIYKNPNKPVYEEQLAPYRNDKTPVALRGLE